LALNFTFQKTPLVQKVLEKIFTQLQLINVLGPLKGFNHLNLSLNFASASEMDKYEKLRVFGKVVNKIQTGLISVIKGEITDEVILRHILGKVHLLQSRLQLRWKNCRQ
jgi:hypothetical protein